MADASLIEEYLAQVGRGVRGRQALRVLAEVEDHLRERAAELVSRNRDERDAEREAIEAFGDPAAIADAFNDVGGAMPSKFTRWSGLAGMLGVVLMAVTFAFVLEPPPEGQGDPEPPIVLLVGFALVAVGFAGLIARTWGAFGRWRGVAVAILTGAGLALGPFAWGLVGWVCAALLLTALALVCDVIVREGVLPRPATVLFVVSIVAMSALAPTSLEKQSAPYYLGFAALVSGWMWLEYTLWSERPARTASVAAG
jgi:hypothetical protein